MSKKLFVGGLPWATTEDRLREVFESYGEVTEAKIIVDRETDRSRGFGFVTLADAEDAQRAMTELDDSELDGRRIRVQEATERSRSSGGGGGERRGSGGGGRGRRPRDDYGD